MNGHDNGNGPHFMRTADGYLEYIGSERRGAIERRGAWRCQTCNSRHVHIAGSPSIGAQIWKCDGCGHMDRRLPQERRRPWSFAPAARPWIGLVAIAAGVVAAGLGVLLLILVLR